MADPFDGLRAPFSSVEPDPAFAARLRARLAQALILAEGADVTDTGTELDEPGRGPTAPVGGVVITPYLAVAGARRAIDWYVEAFGARLQGEAVEMPDGKIGHAELDVGGARLMLADEYPAIGHRAPQPGGGATVTLHAQVGDVDGMVERALQAGATLVRAPQDQPYGRNAAVTDPFGHRWLFFSPPRQPSG